jgi:hypothetical protein
MSAFREMSMKSLTSQSGAAGLGKRSQRIGLKHGPFGRRA